MTRDDDFDALVDDMATQLRGAVPEPFTLSWKQILDDERRRGQIGIILGFRYRNRDWYTMEARAPEVWRKYEEVSLATYWLYQTVANTKEHLDAEWMLR